MVPVDSFPISGSAMNRARGSSTPLRFVLSHLDRVLLLWWNTLATAAGRRRKDEPWMRLGPRNLRSAVDNGSSKEEGFSTVSSGAVHGAGTFPHARTDRRASPAA